MDNAGTENTSSTGDENWVREQDRLLPIANVGRIMKQILPPNAKISKEAKETMQECVSEFIAFVTGEASEKCRREKRKTVNGDDVCWALGTLGFDDYAFALKRYLKRYRDLEGADNNSSNDKGGDDVGGESSNRKENESNMAGTNAITPPQVLATSFDLHHQGVAPSSSTSSVRHHHQSNWLD